MKNVIQGCCVAVLLIVCAEAVTFGYDIARTWIEVNWGSTIKAAIKQKPIDEDAARELKLLEEDEADHVVPDEPEKPPAQQTEAVPVVRADLFPLTVSSKDGKGTNSIEVTDRDRYKIAVTEDQFTHPDPEMQHYASALAEHDYTTQLPDGTRYAPVLDAASCPIVIREEDGSFPGILVNVRSGPDDEKHYLVPLAQFEQDYRKVAP